MAVGMEIYNASGVETFSTVDFGWCMLTHFNAAAGVSGSLSVASLADGREIRAHSIPILNGSGHFVDVDQTNKIVVYTAIVLPTMFLHRTSPSWIFVFGR